MDVVAVDTVVEVGTACSDRDQAEAGIRALLAGARAPKRGGSGHWKIVLRVSKLPKGGREAHATITDDDDVVVSERTLSDATSKTCLPLARAAGAWATLVFDDELTRAEAEASKKSEIDSPRAPVVNEIWEPRDVDKVVRTETESTIEVGAASFVRAGFGSPGTVGGTPWMSIEVSPSWVLRPSLAFGHFMGEDAGLSNVGARVDFCRRIPGNYVDRKGIMLDLCGDTAFDVVWPHDASGARASIGASINLRGELGAGFTSEVRAMGGIAFLQSQMTAVNASPLGMGAEVGLAKRF